MPVVLQVRPTAAHAGALRPDLPLTAADLWGLTGPRLSQNILRLQLRGFALSLS